jgi:hypothetical protein
MRGGGGDDRGGLDAGGAGADQPDALAGEVHAVMRPAAGVVPMAGEAIQARQLGHVRRRQAADGGDQEARGETLAGFGRDLPPVGGFIVTGAGDAGAELDVGPQREPVGDVVEVAHDLRLLRIALAPVPFLLQLLREGIGI